MMPACQIPVKAVSDEVVVEVKSECQRLYEEMQLEGTIDYTAFERAYDGYCEIGDRKQDIITLIDFTKPSTDERLYILDMKNRRMVLKSHVAHGRNSGENYATSFSNVNGSHKSSLGFYLTGDTYQGRNGYSLLLHGLEKGINDKARERAIVIHSAAYANPSVASRGRLGRSFGCPALPEAVNKTVIDLIKGGTVLYINANDPTYLSQSIYVNRNSRA